jgi:hypothetical protein
MERWEKLKRFPGALEDFGSFIIDKDFGLYGVQN